MFWQQKPTLFFTIERDIFIHKFSNSWNTFSNVCIDNILAKNKKWCHMQMTDAIECYSKKILIYFKKVGKKKFLDIVQWFCPPIFSLRRNSANYLFYTGFPAIFTGKFFSITYVADRIILLRYIIIKHFI